MKKLVTISTMIIVTLLLMGCGDSHSNAPEQVDSSADETLAFRLPEIPLMLSGQKDREEYLALHYWDLYQFGDSAMVYNDSISGLVISSYISLLERLDDQMLEQSATRVVELSAQAPNGLFHRFIQQLEHYLYNPNSPVRNEELYLPIARAITLCENIEEVDKTRSRYILDMLLKNRIATVATDFSYTLSDGSTRKMSQLDAPYTILFFNSPDCDDCKRVKRYIEQSELLNSLSVQSQIKILALYPEDDLELWRSTTYPSIMINGYDKDQAIYKQRLYDLKAIPTLYLLDQNKSILLKDVFVEQIEQWFAEHIN